jgi:NAD(P)-dependent dehydrogenase (short-subunit alcohol dehydrogenase family)
MQQNSEAMQGKICLVTGATSGIGKATATALADMGGEVIISGRNQEKTEKASEEIIHITGNKNIHHLLADFSDLEQVRQAGLDIKNKFSQIDVLVNNAGAFFNTRYETKYGVEKTFLVNHLAPFLLTNLLLDVMLGTEPARIINVSSDAHQYGTIDFDDLGFTHGYAGFKAYARSKLANVLFTYEAARRLEGNRITVNALHPGHVTTDIWRTSFSFFGPIIKSIMGLFALSPEEGADNSIYLASAPDVEGVTGKYYVEREPAQSSLLSYDQDLAQHLWKVSENLTSISWQALGSSLMTS